MELLRWTLFYLSVLSITIVLAVIGWKIGAKIKHAKTESRHKKDMKVIEEFENVE